MMKDYYYLISREEVLKAVANIQPHDIVKEEGHIYATLKTLDVIDAIYQMPHAKPEQAVEFLLDQNWLEEHDHVITTNWWIPVSEALPEKDGRYLVSLHEYGDVGFYCDDYKIIIMRFKDGKWRKPISMPQWVEDALIKEVTAWMPLPHNPYEVKEE